MTYFVTGGTGFIGRHLVEQLSARGEPVHLLVRAGSRSKFERVVRQCGAHAHRVVAVEGDLGAPGLGIAASQRAALVGRVSHVFHLGALYDLRAGEAQLARSNVAGTEHALAFARDIDAGGFHFVSSIAAAGRYRGTFTEEMFAQAGPLDHPYFRSKHDAEARVRTTCRIPWQIYRPGMVVGHSVSGEMDKVDGPYYLFKLIQRLRETLPRWVPLIGIVGGHVNLVPVDFVAAALDRLAHVPGVQGRCFHLTDPHDYRVGEVLNLFAAAAHAPQMRVQLDRRLIDALALGAHLPGEALQPLRRILDELLSEVGVPSALLRLIDHPTTFDCRHAEQQLAPAGIHVPPLAEYAWRLWDFWERQLDPDRSPEVRLRRAVQGKTVLITGGSSGIGLASARKLGAAGARVILVARDAQRLEQARAEVAALGAEVSVFACNLTEPSATDALLHWLAARDPPLDILIHNAGHSIRRGIDATYDRLHDYERLMQINYVAAVRLTLGVLPCMTARASGHVISISSIGVLTHASRFAAYNASKAALEAFTRCASGEFAARGVRFTVVNLPLVRTAMVAPTKVYDAFELLSPQQAADLVCDAVARRPERLSTGLGRFAQIVDWLAPQLTRAVMGESFRMFPDSQAAGGPADGMTAEARAFSALLREWHF